MKPELFKRIGVFIVKLLIRLSVCLSELFEIHLSLRRLVVFLDVLFLILVHFMLGLIMLLFDVTCVVLLTIILLPVLSMHVILNLIHSYL